MDMAFVKHPLDAILPSITQPHRKHNLPSNSRLGYHIRMLRLSEPAAFLNRMRL